jgi:serine/threonine-protein kinase
VVTRLGEYRLERLLGEGATGSVYAAVAANGERLALKLLRAELDQDEVVRARFLREARLARGLDSRHVVPILATGEADGATYLVMPLFEASLADRLRDGPLELDRTVDLAAELARGLDLLHGRGILHRDVKPSNVLLDRDGTAALSDFGLARTRDSTRLTDDGQLVGTPHYLAPELIEGGDATRASDVYALGCVLYQCLAGTPPFGGRGVAEVAFAHLVEPAPDVSHARPELPRDVGAAVLTALAKNPSARPPTATALARLLHVARSSSPASPAAG